MNFVVRELAKKHTLQQFLLALLDDLEKYFRTAPPLSQEKAHATLQTIFARIARHFPLVSSLHNLSRRLSKDLADKVIDRTEKNGRSFKKGSGLKSFMEGIEAETDALASNNSEESQENLNAWVKKVLLEGISELKEDIREADEQAASTLAAQLPLAQTQTRPTLVFLDSFLTNQSLLTHLSSYCIKRVSLQPRQLQPNEISIFNAASSLRTARALIISADAVLRNGGVLARNGALLLAVAAHQLGIPVVAVTRSYCLWEHIMVNQESLVGESGRNCFPEESESNFRVLVGKKYDYLQPKLVGSLVSESKAWQSQSIVEIFEAYYY